MTIHISEENWKALSIKKIHNDLKTYDDVISQLLGGNHGR